MRIKILSLIAAAGLAALAGCAGESAAPPEGGEAEGSISLKISCGTLVGRPEALAEEKRELVPEDGVILSAEAALREGDSAFDALLRECRAAKIPLEFSETPGTGAKYVEGIYNIYEFDAGELSGWTYSVTRGGKREFPGMSSSSYALEDGDEVEWLYTLELGADVGDTYGLQGGEGNMGGTDIEKTPEAIAAELLLTLRGGNADEILAFMDDTMRAALGETAGGLWGQLTAAYGEFSGAGDARRADADGYNVVLTELFFEKATLVQRTVTDGEGRVAGLFFTEGELPGEATPEAAAGGETPGEDVTFSASERYPIRGTLTLPAPGAGEAPFPAVALVHGSGPSDRDGTVGANRVFADISKGLASEGIAVLRYDKRTYTHGAEIASGEDYAEFTVEDETTDDAAAAVRFLKSDPRIDADRIYLLGHSMGGGLLSYVGESEPVAGYVIMAGTTRRLWELMAEQNLALAEELGGSAAETARELVRAETEKALRLAELTDEEALSASAFGLPALYLRSFEGIDAAALHLADKKPVLILQGGRDRQVPPGDLELWKAALRGHPGAEFKLYPALNHIFGEYGGAPTPLPKLVETEYGARTPVAEEVIADIAAFVKKK
jgi:dienelactone hydrolase